MYITSKEDKIKMKKRVLSLLLVLAMFVTLAPIAAFATGTTEHTHTETATTAPTEETAPAPAETEVDPTPVPTETVPDEQSTAPDAVAAAQALIDALPAPEDFTPADLDAYFAACDALDALSPEQLELITGMDKLAAIEALLNDPTSADEPTTTPGDATAEDAGATVSVDSNTYYFSTLAKAAEYTATTSNATVVLNKPASIDGTLTLAGIAALNLNGNNITAGNDMSAISLNSEITLTGKGDIAPPVTVTYDGGLTVDTSYNGTINTVTVKGKFIVNQVGTNLHVNTLSATIRSSTNVQLAGGTYGSISTDVGSSMKLGESTNPYAFILVSGYAFQATTGAGLVPWSSMDNTKSVSVVSQGTHTDNKKYDSTNGGEQAGSDGMCDYCCATLYAKLEANGATTFYATIDAALTAANKSSGGTVTLLRTASLSDSLAITAPITIELNGFTLAKADVTLTLNNSLTVSNSGSETKEFMPKINVATGGKFTPTGDKMDFHEVSFSGGTFGDLGSGCLYRKIATNVSGGKLLAVLPTDTSTTYAFYKYDSSDKTKSDTVADASGTSLTYVYVKAHTHTMTDGKCTCGFECTHHNISDTGYCTDCKTTYIAKVTKANGDLVGYYTTLDDAVNKPSGAETYTVKLLNSVTLDKNPTNINRSVKLNLNGNNITYASTLTNPKWITGANVEIVGSGSISGTIRVNGGTLTLAADCSATFNTVDISNNGKLTVAPKSTVTVEELKLDTNTVSTSAAGTYVSLSAGTYNSITCSNKKEDYAKLLAPGYCYADADENPIALADDMANKKTVKVILHTTHDGFMEDGECDYCGAQLVLVTAAGGMMYTYHTLDSALDAANDLPGCTVKLLRDMPLSSDVTLTGAFTIDLNGHNVTGSATAIMLNSSVTFTNGGSESAAVGPKLKVASDGTLKINSASTANITLNTHVLSGGSIDATGKVTFTELSVVDGKVIDLLSDGYAFKSGESIFDGSVTSASNVTIVSHTCNWVSDSSAETTIHKCDCGRVCTHENLVDGKCQKCETQFYAEHTYTSGSVEVKKLFDKLTDALVSAENNGGTVKLLTDYVHNGEGDINLSKTYTLDLNGHNITHSAGDVNVFGNITLTDSSTGIKGTVKADKVEVYDTEDGTGKLTVDGGVTIELYTADAYSDTVNVRNGGELVLENGTIKGKVYIADDSSNKLTVTGGTFALQGTSGKVEVRQNATAALSGGTFAKIEVDDKVQFPSLLVKGYAFFDGDNKPIALSTINDTKLQNVTVKKCTDHKPTADGKCDYCKADLTFEVTYKFGTTTVTEGYTADQIDAVCEAAGDNGRNGTVKLLKDYTYNGDFSSWYNYTIDLNGYNFTISNGNGNGKGEFNVSSNITLTDNSNGSTKGTLRANLVDVYNPGGKLTVNNGVTIERNTAGDSDTVQVRNGGELVLNNGTIKGKVSITKDNNSNNPGKLTVTGGTFDKQGDYGQLDVKNGASATISGGTFNHVLHVTDGASATISGGAFNGIGMQVKSSTVALSGGKFEQISTFGTNTITSLLANDYGYQYTAGNESGAWTLVGKQVGESENELIEKVEVKKLPVQNLTLTSDPDTPKYGETITLTAFATDNNDTALTAPDTTYQWYQKSGETWAEITGATSADYKPYDGTNGTAPTPGDYEYKCAVKHGGFTAEKEITVTVVKADSTLSVAPTAKTDLVYNGLAQALLDDTEVAVANGKLMYSLDKNGTYSETIPTGTDAKEYTVWYKVVGDTHYNDLAPQSIKATIARCPVTVADIADSSGNPKPHSKVYDGTNMIYPSALIFNDKDGNKLNWTVGEDYILSTNCTFDNANVGKNKTITCPVTLSNENYCMINNKGDEIFAATFTDGEITKATPTITATNVDNNNTLTLTYGDTATITATAQKAAPFAQDEPGALSFGAEGKSDGEIISVDSTTGVITPKKAGTATVVITSAETDNYNKGEKKITVKVEKRDLTLRAAALTAHVGDTAPDLSAPVLGTHYTLEGLVNGDTALDSGVTVQLSYQGLTGRPVMTAPGTYVIIAQTSNTDSRYNIICENGSLTVDNITITATAGAGGSIDPSGKVDVAVNSSKTFTITPAAGYAVANVKVDGVGVGAVRSYTFTNITTSHTIEAIFMPTYGNPQTGVDVD